MKEFRVVSTKGSGFNNNLKRERQREKEREMERYGERQRRRHTKSFAGLAGLHMSFSATLMETLLPLVVRRVKPTRELGKL